MADFKPTRLTNLGHRTNNTSPVEWWLTDAFQYKHHNQNDPNKHWTIDVHRLIESDGFIGTNTRYVYIGTLPNFRWIAHCTTGAPISISHYILDDKLDIPVILPEALF